MIPKEKVKELEKKLEEMNLLHLVDEKIKEFYGLITRDVAIELVAYERGLLSFEKRISQLKEGDKNFVLIAYVKQVLPPVKSDRYVFRDVVIYDESGEITLRLWNDDVNLKVKAGDKIRITHGYVKFGKVSVSKIGGVVIEEFGKPVEVHECNEGLVPLLSGIYQEGFLEGKGVKLQVKLNVKDGTKVILENVEVRNGSIFLKPFSRVFVKKT